MVLKILQLLNYYHMRRRNNHLLAVITGSAVLVLLLTIVACKGRNKATQHVAGFETSIECSQMDTDTKGATYYIFVPGITYLPF
jgi:hypothetical protein